MTNNLYGSIVMEEFIKIAKDSGFLPSKLKKDKENVVGNPYTDTPVKDHRRYEPDPDLYGVTKEEDIIEKAHPKKVQMADSQGEGGVVENVNEQQEKDIEVATKMPHGSLLGTHAEVINNLVKLANYYDSIGNTKVANHIDSVIKKIYHPFDNGHLHKEAFWPVVIGLLGAIAPLAVDHFMNKGISATEPKETAKETYDPSTGKVTSRTPMSVSVKKSPSALSKGLKGVAGVSAAIGLWPLIQEYGYKISSTQEGILKDTQDLVDILTDMSDTAPSAGKAVQMLQNYNNKIHSLNLSDEKQFNQLVIETKKMQKDLYQIKQLILRATKIEDTTILPFGESKRVEGKLEDFEESLKQLEEIFKNASAAGDKIDAETQKLIDSNKEQTVIGSKEISDVQTLLSVRGFAGKTWNIQPTGEMDKETTSALQEIQNLINKNEKVQEFVKSKGLKGTFSVIQGNELKGTAKQLEGMFEFVEEKFI